MPTLNSSQLITLRNLLSKVVVSLEENRSVAIHDTLCILEKALDIVPKHNILSCPGIAAGGDIGDSGGRPGSKRL